MKKKTTIPSTEGRASFTDIINETAYAKTRFVIEKKGKPFAAIVPIEDLDILEKAENQLQTSDAQ